MNQSCLLHLQESRLLWRNIRNAVLWIAGNLPSDGKVPEREKTLDVAKQVSQLNVRREILPPDAWGGICILEPDACSF